jgi:hypothetical protein
MKNRHLKTLEERFGVNEKLKTKNDLSKKCIEFNKNLKFYYNKIKKDNSKFNLNDAFNFCSIIPKGIFYLRAKSEDKNTYGSVDMSDSSFAVYEKVPKQVKFKTDNFMTFCKFYVIDISLDGYIWVIYEYPNSDIDYDFIQTNKILLEGNIGIYIK